MTLPRSFRRAHGLSAALLALFVAAHMLNHAVGLFGEERHIAFMRVLRLGYRAWPVEALLIALLAWQAGSGVVMVVRGWRGRRGAVAWTQALSGGYLALFLLVHISAVLNARTHGIDTDVRFAGQGLSAGLAWFFVPYYGLAVTALATHLGCAIFWARGGRDGRIVAWSAFAGGTFAALILASLGGIFFPVHPAVLTTGAA